MRSARTLYKHACAALEHAGSPVGECTYAGHGMHLAQAPRHAKRSEADRAMRPSGALRSRGRAARARSCVSRAVRRIDRSLRICAWRDSRALSAAAHAHARGDAGAPAAARLRGHPRWPARRREPERCAARAHLERNPWTSLRPTGAAPRGASFFRVSTSCAGGRCCSSAACSRGGVRRHGRASPLRTLRTLRTSRSIRPQRPRSAPGPTSKARDRPAHTRAAARSPRRKSARNRRNKPKRAEFR